MLILFLLFVDLTSSASLSAETEIATADGSRFSGQISPEEKESLFIESLVSLASSILSANHRHGDVCESIRRLELMVTRLNSAHSSMLEAMNLGDARKASIHQTILLRAIQDHRLLRASVFPLVCTYATDVTDLMSSFKDMIVYGQASSLPEVRAKLNEIFPFMIKLDDIFRLMLSWSENHSEQSPDRLEAIGQMIALSVEQQQAFKKILEFQVESEKPLRELIALVGNSAPLLLQESIGKLPSQKPKKKSTIKADDDDWLSGVVAPKIRKSKK